jgi:hypothetical protein
VHDLDSRPKTSPPGGCGSQLGSGRQLPTAVTLDLVQATTFEFFGRQLTMIVIFHAIGLVGGILVGLVKIA